MERKDYFTELSFRHKLPDEDGVYEVSVRQPAWDCSADELLCMFYAIYIGAGYHPDSFQRILSDYLQERDYDVIEKEDPPAATCW